MFGFLCLPLSGRELSVGSDNSIYYKMEKFL